MKKWMVFEGFLHSKPKDYYVKGKVGKDFYGLMLATSHFKLLYYSETKALIRKQIINLQYYKLLYPGFGIW